MLAHRTRWGWLQSDPGLLFGVLCTVTYYVVICQHMFAETWLAKYTTEHEVEYVIVTLFFWGVCDMLAKLSRLPREQRAMNYDWIPQQKGMLNSSHAHELSNELRAAAPQLLTTRIGRRVMDVLKFIAVRGDRMNLREQLEHLSNQEEDELHSEYTTLRFLIAVTPILGFLGTVVHFGTSIGSFSFSDMDAKLPVIVAGMGTAFNTTSVALATAMTLMFSMFLCERFERGIVHRINKWVESDFQYRFAFSNQQSEPLLAMLESTQNQATASLQKSFEALSETWNQELIGLFKWFQEQRREELNHFAAGIRSICENHETHELSRENQLQKLTTELMQGQASHWQNFQHSLDRATSFRDDTRELLTALNSIAQGEGRLAELQAILADNLRVLQETSQLDSAVNGLTAAIHLMTSRSRPFGISDSAAA